MNGLSGATVAPYPVRRRLAVTGLAIAWTLAALFLVLGIRTQSRPPAPALDPAVAVVSVH